MSESHSGTVYVVDDDRSIRDMLADLVSTIGVQVHAYSSASEFLTAYRPKPCECLVCDLRMPDIDGVELQQRLQGINSALPIIFLTGFAEVDVAVEAMRNGALDFVQKPFSARALLAKIQAGLDISRIRFEKVRHEEAKKARESLLTPKEIAIVRMVVDAKSSREISEELNLSVRTVENHRTRIMEKLHVESTVELVKLFL